MISRVLDEGRIQRIHEVPLSIGSDCHTAHYDVDFERVGQLLERAGLRDDFWCLDPGAT